MDLTQPDVRPAKESAVARAQHGDVEAFGELYREHAGRIFALCVRMTGDRVRAEELMQDTFVRAWERLRTFRGESSFASWLHRLAVNVVLTSVRTTRRREARVETSDNLVRLEARMGAGSSPGEADLGIAIDLERAIAALPQGARHAFVLHDVEGFSHLEIAQLTGLAEGTIRAQLHRARKLLMEALR